jgi:hypothetical protein
MEITKNSQIYEIMPDPYVKSNRSRGRGSISSNGCMPVSMKRGELMVSRPGKLTATGVRV